MMCRGCDRRDTCPVSEDGSGQTGVPAPWANRPIREPQRVTQCPISNRTRVVSLRERSAWHLAISIFGGKLHAVRGCRFLGREEYEGGMPLASTHPS